MLLYRKRHTLELTDADFKDISAAITKFSIKFKATIARHMPSRGNTIKFHKQVHAPQCMQLLGNLSNVHAQFMEAKHHRLKTLHAATNKREDTFLDQMVRKARLSDVLDSNKDGIPARPVRRQNNTIHAQAAELGHHTMAADGITLTASVAAGCSSCSLLS
jgi:hypothetical protein